MNEVERFWKNERKNKEDIQLALEEYIEEFIKRILSKYLPKVNKKDFRYDMILREIGTLKSVVDGEDFHGLVTYWGPKFKGNIEGSDKFFKKVLGLSSKYTELSRQLNKISPETSNTGIWSRRNKMQDNDTWTKYHEKRYVDMQVDMKSISIILNDFETSVNKLKQLMK